MVEAFKLGGGKLWGNYRAQEYGVLQDFMLRAGLIKAKVPDGSLIVGIPGFFEKVNAFDHKPIEDQAKACAGA